jgi:ribosomal protein S13
MVTELISFMLSLFRGTRHMLNLKFPIKGQEGKASAMFTNKATAMNALMLIKNRTIKGEFRVLLLFVITGLL